MPVRSDERSHVLGCFGKGKLKTCDGGENLGETNEHIRHGLRPDIDRSICALVPVHVLAALASGVDVVLDDSGGNHSKRSKEETECNALNGSEPDVGFAESWIQEVVDNRDKNDERDGVEVGDEVVGHTVTCHSSGLRCQVVVHLVVGEPCVS